ncbi:MAG: hypothetical protein K8R02_00615 [Anaerohalosphaeraceae bacterium]|nr:hypothetical protein [Anaerohalosphaeraceae bacterium]
MENNELELSWIMRLRIASALAIGICLVGILGERFIAPLNPMDPTGLVSGNITIISIGYCCGLAFLAGLAAAAIATPFGRQIGPIAAPAGMCFWAIKTGSLASVFQGSASSAARVEAYSSMQLEGFVWLSIAAAGYLGSLAMSKVISHTRPVTQDKFKPAFKLPFFLVVVIAVCGTVFVADRIICLLARDVSYFDAQMGNVYGNPGNKQIALAIIAGFAVAAFLAKIAFGSDFLWSALAVIPLTYYTTMKYGNPEIAEYMSSTWPAMFFVRPAAAVLPVQIAAFGPLGAILGYWLAARFHTWRTTQD